ncbi:MAG: putative toxin-antitoxin system toxin component, PIN family [Xanthomonadales bacterium]|nr:putative toxin-antitoxin system toxin component, PIN family [Xanthomonadales bacterium]
MRLVLDTNTALSGLLWGGVPGRLIEAAEQQHIELASSTALLAELQGVLSLSRYRPREPRTRWFPQPFPIGCLADAS